MDKVFPVILTGSCLMSAVLGLRLIVFAKWKSMDKVFPVILTCSCLMSAVYGGLDLHGLAPSVKWTRLARTVMEGDNVLVLEEPVDWSVGDEIMVTTTDASPWHTETFTVTDITGTSVTISPAAQYQHIGEYHSCIGVCITLT